MKRATILRKPRRSLSRYIKESDPSAREPGTWQMQALPYLPNAGQPLHGDDAMLTSPLRAKGMTMEPIYELLDACIVTVLDTEISYKPISAPPDQEVLAKLDLNKYGIWTFHRALRRPGDPTITGDV